jgi:hypothetical protein
LAIALETVEEIKRLGRARRPIRQISRLTGVSRGTVAAILEGRWRARSRKRKPPEEPPSGPFRRCPGCGGMVLMPCQACRALDAKRHPPADSDEEPAPLSIDLTGRELCRYRHIRRKRASQSGDP